MAVAGGDEVRDGLGGESGQIQHRVNRVRVWHHKLTNTRATKCPIYLRGRCQIQHLVYEGG